MIHPYWSIANFSAFWMCGVFNSYFHFPAYQLSLLSMVYFKGVCCFSDKISFLWILNTFVVFLNFIMAKKQHIQLTNSSSLTFFATLDTLCSVFTHPVKSLWVRVSRQGAEGASYLQGKECWWTCWEMNAGPLELEKERARRANSTKYFGKNKKIW